MIWYFYEHFPWWLVDSLPNNTTFCGKILANPSIKLHGDFHGKMGFTKQVETTYSGWWLSPTPLKNMKVNGKDYSIPYIMEKQKMFQTTNQYLIYLMISKVTIHSIGGERNMVYQHGY